MSDQFEYQCPQCRSRTTVPADHNPEEVICSKCDAVMVKKAATSQVAEASANAPARSSNQAPVAVATASGRTKTAKAKSVKATKSGATKTRSTARSRAAEAEAAIAVVIPEFGSFRCPCCGMAKTILPGEGKPGLPARCQTCFVKLDFLK